MTSQGFLWLSIALGLIFIVAFMRARRSVRQPSKLNLRASGTQSNSAEHQMGAAVGFENATPYKEPKASSGKAHQNRQSHETHDSSSAKTSAENFDEPSNPEEKKLNVIFNYNGHSWDAHEILGVPAGSNLAAIEQAFKEMCAKSDKESREFLEAAYRAIRSEIT